MIARKLSAATRQHRTRPLVRHLLFVGCLGFGPLVASCGARWTPEAEYVAQSDTDAGSAYTKLLKVLADRGYHVTEQRDADRYVQVRAHIDENFVSRQSFIAAQVDPAGVVHFTPSGHLVRENHVHKKLASELLDLQYAMRGDVGSGPAPAASTAPAAPVPETPASAAPTPTTTAAPTAAAVPTTSSPAPKTSSKPRSTSAAAPKPSPKPASDDWVPVK